jgi:hypothetical protein
MAPCSLGSRLCFAKHLTMRTESFGPGFPIHRAVILGLDPRTHEALGARGEKMGPRVKPEGDSRGWVEVGGVVCLPFPLPDQPFGHSPQGLLTSNRSTGAIWPAARFEAPQGGEGVNRVR